MHLLHHPPAACHLHHQWCPRAISRICRLMTAVRYSRKLTRARELLAVSIVAICSLPTTESLPQEFLRSWFFVVHIYLLSSVNQAIPFYWFTCAGLRKVTPDMQTHKNPGLRTGPAPFKAPAASTVPSKKLPQPGAGTLPDKPPVFTRDGKKWLIVRDLLEFSDKKTVDLCYFFDSYYVCFENN